jgi:hypothetical protein
VGLPATSGPRTLGLVATPDPRALDVGLATRSCHESMITK